MPRLEPLAKPGEPWFGTAGEMTALALVKQGKKQEAGQLFAAIAKDKTVPQSIRDRAVQVAGTLGVDASAALAPRPNRTKNDKIEIFPRCSADRRGARRERLQHLQEGKGPSTPVLGQRIAVLTGEATSRSIRRPRRCR